jgi:hypothetical protein
MFFLFFIQKIMYFISLVLENISMDRTVDSWPAGPMQKDRTVQVQSVKKSFCMLRSSHMHALFGLYI